MSNLTLLKEGYQKFAEQDIEGVTAMWKDNIHWHECASFPFVTNDGTYVGAKAIVEGVFANIPIYYDNFNIEIADFVDGGDKIVMVGHYTGTWKATGKKFKANVTHVWKFEDGKVAEFIQAVDTAEIMNP